MIDSKNILTVSQFSRLLSDSLRSAWPSVRIQGELASFTKASSGHWYFTLKDDQAQLKAVMFRARNVLAGFTPVLGDKVEVLAQLSVYEPRGDLQLVVDVLKKAGQGNLYEQFLALKAKLAQEGLFDAARKQPLPAVPFSVGVVTSLQAAALADVRQALTRRAPHLAFCVYPTQVQGEGAELQIRQALQRADSAGHDVLILCRGGGSLEDLWCFNTEVVVRAVAACQTPIVVGVGHETDVTLAEFAADLRAATPTAAAELICPPTMDLLDAVASHALSMGQSLRQRLSRLEQQVDRAEFGLVTPRHYADRLAGRLDALARGLAQPLNQHLQSVGHSLAQWSQRLSQQGRKGPQVADSQLQVNIQAMKTRLALTLQHTESVLVRRSEVLEAVSPQRTLERGFAYLQDETEGRVLSSVAQAQPGQAVKATLKDGHLSLGVTAVKKHGGADPDPFTKPGS